MSIFYQIPFLFWSFKSFIWFFVNVTIVISKLNGFNLLSEMIGIENPFVPPVELMMWLVYCFVMFWKGINFLGFLFIFGLVALRLTIKDSIRYFFINYDMIQYELLRYLYVLYLSDIEYDKFFWRKWVNISIMIIKYCN